MAESRIVLRAFIDGPVSEDDKEALECAGTEILAGFPEHEIDVQTVRADAPESIRDRGLDAWVFMRKELP